MADIRWDDAALGRLIGTAPAVVAEVEMATEAICGRANSMGSAHYTGIYHRDHKSPGVGHTQARYDSDARTFHGSVVGIVHTANYSAMQDNAKNNTLLKARG